MLFLYLDIFVLPATPTWFGGRTQAIHSHNAARMLDGEMIYRDFFQYTPPGTELVYLALFKLFGVRAWIPSGVLVALGLGCALLSIVISRRLLPSPTCYLPGLLFLATAYQRNLDASHHWYSVLAVMAALAVVIEQRTPRRLTAAAAWPINHLHFRSRSLKLCG